MRAIFCILLLTSTVALGAEPVVRVRLFGNRNIERCIISSRSRMDLAGESGNVRATVAPGHEVAISVNGRSLVAERGGNRLDSRIIRASSEDGLISIMGRPYRGEISVRSLDGKIVIINSLPLEDYLRAVVPCEMPVTFHPEALKAQAVVSRTVAVRWLGKHSAEGADFCDLTHCQAYRGSNEEKPSATDAVASTRGLVLTYEGELASVVYHATCGGHTADANSVWPSRARAPYLAGRPDTLNDKAACAQSPHFRWEARISDDELGSAFGVRDAEARVLQTDSAGRAALVEIRWAGGSRQMTGEEFHLAMGRKLGWGRLKSARFSVRPVPGGWLFEGRGLGHGVGMCQWGANGRAQAGQTMAEMLFHYFPGTRLTNRENDAGHP